MSGIFNPCFLLSNDMFSKYLIASWEIYPKSPLLINLYSFLLTLNCFENELMQFGISVFLSILSVIILSSGNFLVIIFF